MEETLSLRLTLWLERTLRVRIVVWVGQRKRISYKTKLMGDSVSHNSMVDLEEDFELQDRDVTMVLVDGVPSIIFFNRVQQFIAWKMALIVVVKLVGKKIGFKTLFNKVSSLWKPHGQFQLMDLENDFYLVHFQNKDDFDKILMGGPWVIFVVLRFLDY
ncbi:hypothetical protein Goklo_029710 [Gossypium klotzschianum]|uniref:DUF4283 domain-containing protein n=1 Tax=Gossypium klotzschianum TaxID=34286 RepID=A0A7J8W3T9_9ROSI|nr:hypothetical protein [Gossypium klotzschianum]